MKVKLIDKGMPVPKYETEKSAGFDLYARENISIFPGTNELVPLNAVIEAPEGYFLMLLPRSSLFNKKGLILANSAGVIDGDYCGPHDEIRANLINNTEEPVIIERGERICQLLILPILTPEIEIVDEMNSKDRHGFGSTGGYK